MEATRRAAHVLGRRYRQGCMAEAARGSRQWGRLCTTSGGKGVLGWNRGPIKTAGGEYWCSSTRESSLSAGASHKVINIRSLGFAVIFGTRTERNGKSLRKVVKSVILVRLVE